MATFGNKDADDNEVPFTEMYLDVLPSTLAGFLAWDIYTEAWPTTPASGWNTDLDGDGILNLQETGGLSATNWDTDSDGLSDKFERENGTSPSRPIATATA